VDAVLNPLGKGQEPAVQGEHFLKMRETETYQVGRKNLGKNFKIHGRMEAIVKEKFRLRMFTVISGRDLLEVLPAYLVASRSFNLGEGLGQGFSLSWMDHGLPVDVQEVFGETVQAHPQQHLGGFQMKVKAGTFHPRPRPLPEPEGQMGFIRGLVVEETSIPIDAEEGFVHPWIGLDTGSYGLETIPQGHNKIPGRSEDMVLIVASMRVKPVLVVVFGKVLKKGQTLSWETGEGRGWILGLHVVP
jgi:hypothetical protein